MNISGIRPDEDFYNHNSIKAAAVRRNVFMGQIVDEEAEQPRCEEKPLLSEPKVVNNGISGQDIQKVLTEMEEDQVLKQYHYFISASELEQNASGSEPVHRSGACFVL